MANTYISAVGQVFGKLTVLGDAPRTGVNRKVTARCECGTVKDFILYNLRTGHTSSCGCLPSVKVKHGHARKAGRHPTYAVYRDMITRCTNPNYRDFHMYGGRGISICERWLARYENFLEDMGERPQGMTIDRWPDKNGNYEPNNCRWATDQEQALNTRRNVFVEHGGRKQTISQWAKELNLDAKKMYDRAKAGWPPERILGS